MVVMDQHTGRVDGLRMRQPPHRFDHDRDRADHQQHAVGLGREHLGALLVGLYRGRTLRFVGKVGTGFTRDTLGALAAKLERVRTDRAPFDPAPRIAGATWVRPKLVAQLAYAEWTADDKLRQPAFLGLRTDKDPSECTWSSRER